MGWAPYLLTTGLCFCISGVWDIAQQYLIFLGPLLLDNAPFSVAGLIILLIGIGTLIIVHLSHHPICQSLTRTTAPRSQVRETCSSRVFLAILALSVTVIYSTNSTFWGEGFVVIMHHERVASLHATKIHEQEPQKVYEPYHTSHSCRQVAKRSYKRACNRARQHGYTWYRGCLVSARQLGVQTDAMPIDKPLAPNFPEPRSKCRQRLLCFNWNAGGLSADAWDAFQLWLENQSIDIISLQETHWPFSSEWAQANYWVLHSGTGKRGGGLLCMVAKRLCPAHLLTWHEPIPGRILHLRIHGSSKNIDVVNVYQHVHASDRMEQRSHFWHQLTTLIDSLPKRYNVVLMGDMNTSLQRRTHSVGLDSYSWRSERCRGPTHHDSNLLQNLLDIHNLVALNTWHHHLGPTYCFDDRHSRIDYIFCRFHLADATSRNVQYLHDFPLQGLTGASHVPLLTSLLKVWHLADKSSRKGWTKAQRLELCQQWLHPNERTQQLQLQVQQSVQTLAMSSQPLDDIQAVLKQFLPMARATKEEPVYKLSLTPFQKFQVHTTRLAALHTPFLGNLFKAWYHIQQRSTARRQMKASSKLARKAKLQKIYEAADAAERAGNPFRMYQAIRSLAPKQTFHQITLRSITGDMLGPDQAADQLCDWFQQLYHDDQPPEEACAFAWPFTLNEFQTGLEQLPLAKALDPQYAPAPFWRWAAEPISQCLDPYFWTCSQANQLPRCWSQGHLCFLPKTKSRTQRPQDLRPIALLEPCGKILMGCLSVKLHEQLWPTLRELPQFAYLQGRGCDDALHRIALHCHEVRTCIDSFKFVIHQKSTGSLPGELGGGLLLSLDLTKAFDAVNRAQLFAGLQQLGISHDLLCFLKSVYCCTSFHFEYRNCSREFFTKRGIRQGCKAAPCLWTAQAALILLSIAAKTNTEWMLHCATLFADDGCFHQVVRTVAELRQLILFLGKTLDVLEAASMTVNLEKTTAMLRLVGPLSTYAQRLFVKRGKQGGAWLRIPRRNGSTTLIKLVKHIQYLGATISYYNFERQTMLARLKAGDKTSQQLTRWLHTSKGFNTFQKIKVWRQCTFACIRYSLIPIGFTASTLRLFDIACIKHLRRICRAPTHLHHTTHQEFLFEHGIIDPFELLLHFCTKAEQRDTQRRSTLAANDILLTFPAIPFHERRQVLLEEWQRLRERWHLFDVPEPDSQQECPVCSMIFVTQAALRRHLTLVHGSRTGALRQPHSFDAREGLPTCRQCGQRFTTWTRFQYHVQYVCTQTWQEPATSREDPVEEVEHRLRVQELLQFASSNLLQALAQRPDLLAYFHTTCCLCQHFSVTSRGLLTHLQTAHSDLFRRHETNNTHLLNFSFSSPCPLCGVAFKQYHRCLLVRQMALLLTRDGHEVSQSALTTDLSCPVCFKAYTTKHGLQKHMRDYHRATEDCNNMDAATIDLRCQLHEAVQSNQCEDLLQLAEVQHFLATRCVLCDRQFNRRQELTRHFKHNHSSEWHECEKRAMLLDNLYKPLHGCLCQPTLHSKHICTLYLQFILLRIEFERELLPPATTLPPDMMMSLAEQIEPLMWNGHVKLLYKKRHVRFSFTTSCQVCGLRFGTAEQLRLHLHEQHAETLQETLHIKELLQWTLFMDLGCFCNPSCGWGEALHECVSLSQLAIVATDFHWQLILPWTFSSVELSAVLEPLLPLPKLQKVTMAMMTRNFHLIWDDSDLQHMLCNNCLLCQEEIPMNRLMPHLIVVHGFTEDRLKYLTYQLCAVFASLMTAGGQCEWCGTVLPCRLEGDDLVEYPEEHLVRCPLVIQFCMLLMIPVWSKPALSPLTWPSHEAIAAAQRQEELKLWQFNADTSDTFGLSIDLLARSGLLMLQDPMLAQTVNHRCLLCSKLFFSNVKFSEHLHRMHNYFQMLALMCYHRLILNCSMPCAFCGQQQHDQTCLSLLNLAVFLTNGHGLRGNRGDRRGQQNLGPSFEQGTDAVIRHRRNFKWQQQTPQNRAVEAEGQQTQSSTVDNCADGLVGQADQTCDQTRRYDQRAAPRDGVHVTFESRQREHLAPTPAGESLLAPGHKGAQGAIETPFSAQHDADLGGPHQDPHGCGTDRGLVSGLCSVPFSGQQQGQDNAVPTLGPSACEAEAQDSGQTATCSTAPELSVRFGVVRLFRNPSGKACAANAVVACLAWMMLLADGFVYELWHSGFELMRNVVSNSLIPMDLLRLGPFGWLLFGEWSIERFLGQQQDASEFCSYLLNITRPRFLNCSWDNRPSFADGLDSVHLAHEKGSPYSPIKLSFIDLQADSCYLQDLIHVWHDAQGLCRAVKEVGDTLILAIDRHDLSHSKCLQNIACDNHRILMPCFSNATGDVSMEPFVLCGVVFHLGQTPFSGHYRAGLKYRGHWLLYEDDTLPEKVATLPESVSRNTILFWLVKPTVANVRTMNEEGDRFPTITSSTDPMLTTRW